MTTEPPEVFLDQWKVAALVTIALVIVLISSSPRNAFYSLALIAGVFFLVNGVLALISRLTRNVDQ
jgi:uncharacterized membrane protein HdeD (DUF308 family)